jgi:hypothetical protein
MVDPSSEVPVLPVPLVPVVPDGALAMGFAAFGVSACPAVIW